ncbi:hypothetical protein [Methylobacterium sp. Leaf100]|uniref:hypothetical protein n=1 Tax=Methylobacterium sp. Leaf100 TaxID=1736252 RepID=UPI0012E25B0F|nr:hypothetical protein [Methylobacterium sp. Leaf100]
MSSDPAHGVAVLAVPAAGLALAILSLPQGYSIIGSLENRNDDEVELLVRSADIGASAPRLKIELMDAGSTRIVRVVPQVPTSSQDAR